MALLYKTNVKATCCLSNCGHAPAAYLYVHEFTNKPNKFFCNDHAEAIVKAMPKSAGFAR